MTQRVRRVKNCILDWKSSGHEREKALNQFAALGLSTAQKLPIFREIATASTDRYIAAAVIRALLSANDPTAFDILYKRMTWLDVHSLGVFVRDHVSRYPFIDRRFLPIARYVVRKVVPLYTPENWEYSSTADRSVVLLALNGEVADRPLIRMALHKMPYKSYTWLAASQAHALTDKERRLARKRLQNIQDAKFVFPKGHPPTYRQMYIAMDKVARKISQYLIRIALADKDEASAQLLRVQIQRFLARYGHLSGNAAMGAALNSREFEENSFPGNEDLMWQLRFMNVPFEENPISRCLDVKNPLIRRTAYIVVADRYPKVFFERLKQGKINVDEMEEPQLIPILAIYCAIVHPEYSQQAKAAIPKGDRQKALDELQKSGISAVVGSEEKEFFAS
jgi:hypothetical protein